VCFAIFEGLVLQGVQVNFMKLYTLIVDDRALLEVTAQTPSWLPVRPSLSARWLRSMVAAALRRYFRQQPAYLRYDGSPDGETAY
jgi:hypothetical protein